MSRLQRCPFLVITEMHLLPTACGSSSIAAFAASPLSSCNEAGKSAREGRNDAPAPTARWKRTRGSNSDGETAGGEEANVSLYVSCITAGSPRSLGSPAVKHPILNKSTSDLKSPKQKSDGNGMERHGIKPLDEEEYGGDHGPL